MPKSSEELTKHTLFLRAGDFEKLRDFYPSTPTSQVVRKIISKVVDNLETPSVVDANVEINL